ncbi:helix-turn-helix domain-containing protein [Spirosoma foliorum]|uniref:Helix-turn-helix domain-containing protein n=1 Tax=Spirosoma foliorum TaxID=2710596 RepID=A0A7G5H1B2_9BACT|nr:helix-turn-helix domain-containing protein [Spirosoma foliorum]QMW04904.1 helix-turn-helix domain-containing protein [Spirosoma foliorum]
MVNYKRLTLQQRYLIQTLNHQHKNQQDIAQQVGVSQSTIWRELAKHNQQHSKQTYEAQQAQQQSATAKKRLPYKLQCSLLTTVLTRLIDRLSPEQICGELQRMAIQKVLHHETIYRYL